MVNTPSHLKELKELSGYLTNLESQLSSFWLTSPALLCIAKDGKFLKVNPAWTTLLGYPIDECVGKDFSYFIHPADQLKTLDIRKTLTAEGTISNFINRYRHKDGHWVTLCWQGYEDPKTHINYATALIIPSEAAEIIESSLKI